VRYLTTGVHSGESGRFDKGGILQRLGYAGRVRSRHGLSLLEVVIVALILGVVAVPLMQGFGTFTRGMHRSTRQTSAVYVAQSILEQIRRRVVLRRAGPPDFSAYAEEGAQVTSEEAGAASQYFLRFENLEGTSFHGITAETDPELHRQLSRYSCEVQVHFDAPDPNLDSDVDGEPEADLAEIGVTVRWEAPGGGERSTTLWTLVTGRKRGTL